MRSAACVTLIALFVAALTACTIQPSGLQEKQDAQAIYKSPNDDRQYQAFTLDNGMQVLLISDASMESAGASVSVGVGSYHNPTALPGLAHYLEHMLFLGTQNYPEPNGFQRHLEQYAGSSNAYTATNHTNYYFQVADTALEESLQRFAEFFQPQAPTFDRDFSDKERHAVNSEWSMGRTQDNRIINRLRGLTANPDHPARQLTVGNLETLVDQPGLPLYETMLAFYREHYVPANMKLVIFSKRSLPELQQLAHDFFHSIPAVDYQRPEIKHTGLTEEQKAQHIYYTPQKSMRRLHLEFAIDDNTEQWQVKPNEYLANLISSEEPGTIADVLREKGWVDDFTVAVQPDYYGKDGFLAVQIGLTPEGVNQIDSIIAGVMAYLDLIREQGINDVYYHELKAMLAKHFVDMQSPRALHQAIHYSATLFQFPAKHIIAAPYVYDHFDRQAIISVLDQLRPEHLRVWHLYQQDKAQTPIPWYEGKYAVEKFTEQEQERWSTLSRNFELRLPEENDLFSTDNAAVITSTQLTPVLVTSSDNLEAWLTHSQYHPSEQGYVQFQFNSPLAQSSASHWILSDLLNRVFAINTMALRDKAGRAGLGIGIERPRDNHALTLTGYTQKHALLYERLLLQWLDLEVTELAFATAVDGFRQWLDGQKTQEPYRQLFAELNVLMNGAAWDEQALREALDALNRDDLLAYHQALLQQHRLRIFAFGNYTREHVAAFVDISQTFLEGDRPATERYLESYQQPQAGATLSQQKTTTQNDNALLIAWYSPATEQKVGATLALLNANFYNAFYTQLRTIEQLGYVVGSTYDRLGDYWGFMVYAQSANTRPEALKNRFAEFMHSYWAELQQLDEVTLDQLKIALIAQLRQSPDNLYSEYPRFINDFYRGNDNYDTRERMIEAIGEVTREDIVTLYQQLILKGESQRVEVVITGAES